MSATNRSLVRRLQDFYETPAWLTRAIIPVLKQYDINYILEPAEGKGAITQVLRSAFPKATFTTGDIAFGQDFCTYPYQALYDLIITNPPYSLALEFIKRALQLRYTKESVVCMLLRVNFLGSQQRASWLREHTPSIHVSPRRPSFTRGGTDATEYCWMIWDNRPPTVSILHTESND